MVTGVEITAAEPADLDSLVKVFGQRHYFAEQVAEPDPAGNQVYLARRGEDLLGTVTIGPVGDHEAEDLQVGFPPSEARLLTHLEVPSPLRNRGLGSLIMADIERIVAAAGFGRIVLGVDLDNPGAARLYRRLGYQLWREKPLPTTQRHWRADGSSYETPDECLIFFKDLVPGSSRGRRKTG